MSLQFSSFTSKRFCYFSFVYTVSPCWFYFLFFCSPPPPSSSLFFLRYSDRISRQDSNWESVKIHPKLGCFQLDFQYLDFKYFLQLCSSFCAAFWARILVLGKESIDHDSRSLPVQFLAIWRQSGFKQIIFSKVHFQMHLNFEDRLYLSLPSLCMLIL